MCSTNLGFSVGYATYLGFSVGYVLCTYMYLCTYVPGISRQKSHHVRSMAWYLVVYMHMYMNPTHGPRAWSLDDRSGTWYQPAEITSCEKHSMVPGSIHAYMHEPYPWAQSVVARR